MLTTRALYSVVQYVPDDSRAEAANVGVVLFVPSQRWLGVRTSPSLKRVRKFFGPGLQELRRIELALPAFEHRMTVARSEFTEESDLASFAAARADAVRLSAPRLVMVEEPASELDALYSELVGDRSRERAEKLRAKSLPPHLAEVFGRLEADGKVWRPGRIRLPKVETTIEVPIAFRNGVVNYVRPESFATARNPDALVARLGFNGQLIARHPIDGQEGRLIVLSSDPKADPATERRLAETLSEFSVRLVPHAEMDAFAVEVEKTAH